MEVTQVRVFPVDEEKLKAFVSIIIDDCFVVSDIKIIQGNNGLFISMPSKKRKNGTFRDIAHPLNSETRRDIEERVIAKYREVLADEGEATSGEIRRLGEGDDPGHAGPEDQENLSDGGEGTWP
jgi:stage V sporulation protein G